jgi:hypothetical protein
MSRIDWSNYQAGREDDPAYRWGYVDGYRAAQAAAHDGHDCTHCGHDAEHCPDLNDSIYRDVR